MRLESRSGRSAVWLSSVVACEQYVRISVPLRPLQLHDSCKTLSQSHSFSLCAGIRLFHNVHIISTPLHDGPTDGSREGQGCDTRAPSTKLLRIRTRFRLQIALSAIRHLVSPAVLAASTAWLGFAPSRRASSAVPSESFLG